MDGIKIVGLGKYLPDKVMTNDDFAKIVDTNDEWITTRTGIRERRFCDGETNAQMAAKAADKAIADAGIDKEQIRVVIVATFTPDTATPSTACMVHELLGLSPDTACIDINAACSGFLYGLQIMRGMLLQEDKQACGLLIGSEVISKYIDMTDRSTCILFGDGAGAAVVKLSKETSYYSVSGTSGNYEVLHCAQTADNRQYITMNGSEVFKFAVSRIPKCIDAILEKMDGTTLEDIDYVVCHQANARIIECVRKFYKAPKEQFFLNMEKYGNTSAASIPIALAQMKEEGKLAAGTKTICVGFGAGLTWAGAYLEF